MGDEKPRVMRALGLLLLLLCPVYGESLSGPAWAALRRAPEVQLYALDPERLQARTSTRLAGADKRALMQALENAVAESDGTSAKCFRPRHALVSEGYAWVICFECSKLFVYRLEPGQKPDFAKLQGGERVLLTDSAADLFNAYLRRAARR